MVLAGCSSTAQVKVAYQFPEVLSEPVDVHAAIIFDEDFQSYVAKPNEKTAIDMGAAQVDILAKAFRGLFSQLDVAASKDGLEAGTEIVIIPSIREVQVSTPSDSYLNVYEVWIKYNLDIESADGEAIDSWFLPAYGKTPDSFMLSKTAAIQAATIIALRDSGAKLMLDFLRIPAVNGWLQQQQSLEGPQPE